MSQENVEGVRMALENFIAGKGEVRQRTAGSHAVHEPLAALGRVLARDVDR